MNRIIDDNVFGSGNLDKEFPIRENDTEEEEVRKRVKDWFRFRKISYYYEKERGIVYLQFVSIWNPLMEGLSQEPSIRLDSVLEEHEFADLQGMLVMFSVCHVILFLQEGAHFDTQLLKKFRLLQTAKQALVPFVKSHIKPPLSSKSHSSSSSSTQPTGRSSSSKISPSRVAGNSSRHSSAISLMSGLGSYPSLFPGQCTPVLLFVFLDYFSEGPNSGSYVEDSAEASSLNPSSNVTRSNLPMKNSSSVVVLSRSMTKSEGGLKKKLQSSLEAQIRFLIKKCRTLAGSEGTHVGSRGAGNVSSAPLFSLEASKAVALIDRSTNQKGEPLDFAAGLIEEILKSKATSDILLLESSAQGVNREDIQSIKEFIYRQCDTLRGRGGTVGNANSGSAAGVGMVAVAAAAAAASAASGKQFSTPELPSLENWLTFSQAILNALLSTRKGYLDKSDIVKRKPLRRNAVTTQVERVGPGSIDPVEAALCWLESCKGLNMKFSTSWCLRALPTAKEVYLKDLPSCYPTSLHEGQLEKALHAFHSMVKGPAVQLFRKKLEEECTLTWISGRQLCDAVSLTGKPCMHKRHNVDVGGSVLEAEAKPHSSGFVFLHACACGRSRQLRDDPFDFETANITFNRFPDCDDLLPSCKLPAVSHADPIQPSSWSLIRVGGSKYYQPSKGLLQSGFSSTGKYLLKWSIYLEKRKRSSLPGGGAQERSVVRSNMESKVEPIADEDRKNTEAALLFQGEARSVEKQKKDLEHISTDDQKISFGRGLPHFTMRRPFAEVVAGSVATDAAFPPLQQRQAPAGNLGKTVKQKVVKNKSEEQVHIDSDCQGSKKCEDLPSVQDNSCKIEDNTYSGDEPLIQIGSNIVPVAMNVAGKTHSDSSLKDVIAYVGFEHECSHGHRFLLNSENLDKLGPLYSLPEDSYIPVDLETSKKKVVDSSNLMKSVHGAFNPYSNGMVTTAQNVKTSSRLRQVTARNEHRNGLILSTGSENEHDQTSHSKSFDELSENLHYVSLDDDGSVFSLLNRNLPLYMNCPHCMNSKKDQQKFKFANQVSQLQRIFLVTPPFPTILGTCPVVQFEDSCLPPTVMDRERQSRFSLGSRVILPPDSFLSLRLPFVYGVQLDDNSLHPLKPLEHQPELTAWITKGTTLQVLSKESSLN
ncbi:Smg8 [Thalictrum thalictroides]|uniref:Nonsense-mediated mRNA decay factor SMG8 n=1 Tax=Thalictrum thalictroides TaxID=46969 RepID=A0A7J6VBT8_THATH|nr:Smg8 [Thalictrum thalictroides]